MCKVSGDKVQCNHLELLVARARSARSGMLVGGLVGGLARAGGLHHFLPFLSPTFTATDSFQHSSKFGALLSRFSVAIELVIEFLLHRLVSPSSFFVSFEYTDARKTCGKNRFSVAIINL